MQEWRNTSARIFRLDLSYSIFPISYSYTVAEIALWNGRWFKLHHIISNYVIERSLLEQPFVKNQSKTVGQVMEENISQLGKALQINRQDRNVSKQVTLTL
jgi:hypothetical protein